MPNHILYSSVESDEPVLTAKHVGLAITLGALASFATLFALPRVLAATTSRMLFLQSAALGMAVTSYVLMLRYIYVDAKRAGMNVTMWLGIAASLNLPGFLIYLLRSAYRTCDWRT